MKDGRASFLIVIFLQVDEMTPSEADVLLAERLLERRSRAGSVLSDQQAQAGKTGLRFARENVGRWFLLKFLTQHIKKMRTWF